MGATPHRHQRQQLHGGTCLANQPGTPLLRWALLRPSNFTSPGGLAGRTATRRTGAGARSTSTANNTRLHRLPIGHPPGATMAAGHCLTNHSHLPRQPRPPTTPRRERPHSSSPQGRAWTTYHHHHHRWHCNTGLVTRPRDLRRLR